MEGYGTVYQSIMRNANITIESKALYAYFAAMSGADCEAFPSVSRICKELGIGKNRFYKSLDSLIKVGVISKEKKNGHIYYKITDGRDGLKMRLQETPTVSNQDFDSLKMRLQQSQNGNLKTTYKNNSKNYSNTGDEEDEYYSPSTARIN